MKKLLLILFIGITSYQLKAQQLTLKPADSLLSKAPNNFNGFKLKDSDLFKSLAPFSKSNQLAMLQAMKTYPGTEIFYSRMPVARLYGNDKMPSVKLNGSDRMPVKQYRSVDPLELPEQVVP